MPGLSGNNFYNATLLTANTAGTQINVVGGQAATAAAAEVSEGKLATITFGGDTTANTLSIFDNATGSVAGNPKFKAVAAANSTATVTPYIQFQAGMVVVLSGGTTPAVTIGWA